MSNVPADGASAARALVEGTTGVDYNALVLFAEPLFSLYGLDLTDAFALAGAPSHPDPEVLAVMETARVLWAYFSLPPTEQARERNALAAQLVGPAPSEDEWIEIEHLLDTVSPYWQALLPEEIADAQSTGHETLDFHGLLAHPDWILGHAHAPRSFGPDALSEIEARALFAQPLLEDPATLLDDAALEKAMERASAYWSLAQTDASEREAALREEVAVLANGSGNRDEIEREARQMVERFHVLFPGHARAA